MFDLKGELSRHYPDVEISYVIANVQDEGKIEEIFSKYKPNYVFHAAAYKHVPLMEECPDEAVKNNVFGTLNVASYAKVCGAEKFILVSTDKAVNPVSVMGATKLITEGIGMMLEGGATKYIAVRFGNVLGSFGSVVPIFQKQIEGGGPVTITDRKMVRYFMTIPEAAQLILKAAVRGEGEELFVLDMGEPVKILDLAESMIRLSGYSPGEEIEIVFTGRRKGEKIKERLFTLQERKELIKTEDKQIYLTRNLGLDPRELPKALDNFRQLVKRGDTLGIRQELSRLIKSFKV